MRDGVRDNVANDNNDDHVDACDGNKSYSDIYEDLESNEDIVTALEGVNIIKTMRNDTHNVNDYNIINNNINDNTTNYNTEDINIDDNTDTTNHFYTQRRSLRMNKMHIKDTNDDGSYIFTTQDPITKFDLHGDTTINIFLDEHTAYMSSLATYSEINLVIQYTATHIILTQLDTKIEIKTWDQERVD